MIKVGINENVFMSKAEVTDKNYLQITFENADKQESSVDVNDPFAVAASGEAIETSSGTRVTVLGFMPAKEADNKNELRTLEQRAAITIQDITEALNKLKHIMSCYTTTTVIAETFSNIYEGTGFTKEVMASRGVTAYHELLVDKDRLEVVSRNVFNSFVTAMERYFGNKELPMRLKLVRQSAEKHYATLPSAKYVNSSPFMEPMSVPKERSKIAFTAYEKNKGLDSDAVVTQSAADATAATPPPAGNPFGTR